MRSVLLTIPPGPVPPYEQRDGGTETIAAELPETVAELLRGLAGRSSLPDSRGMLFDLRTPGYWPFSTRDMLFPLDIVMLQDDGLVVEIARDVPPQAAPIVGEIPYSWVLELPAGWTRRRRLMPGHVVRPVPPYGGIGTSPGWSLLRDMRR